MENAQPILSDARQLLASDPVDEAADHLCHEDIGVFEDYTIDELLLIARQRYKNLFQLRVGPSFEVCADYVAAKSCVTFNFFGYTLFVIHKIPQLQKKD